MIDAGKQRYLDIFEKTISTAQASLSDGVYRSVSVPQILYLTDDYLASPIKLMIMGQETLGEGLRVADIDTSYSSWFADYLEVAVTAERDFNFAYGQPQERSPFWRGYQEICDHFGISNRAATAWTNICKVQMVKLYGSVSVQTMKPGPRIEVLDWQRDLIRAEIEYANPDVIVMLTGGMRWMAGHLFKGRNDTAVEEVAIDDTPLSSGILRSEFFDNAVVGYTYHPAARLSADVVKDQRRTVLDRLSVLLRGRDLNI